jgi:rubrerythrin
MSRYIDADALIKELQHCSYETWSKDINRAWWAQAVKVKDNIIQCIKRQPTADVVEVRHGEWKDRYKNKYANQYYECSVCGKATLDRTVNNGLGNPRLEQALSPFCPNCGAKMDAERREQNEG